MKSVVITVCDRIESKVREDKENKHVVNRDAAQNYIYGVGGDVVADAKVLKNPTPQKLHLRGGGCVVADAKVLKTPTPQKNKTKQTKTNNLNDKSEQAYFNLLWIIFVV